MQLISRKNMSLKWSKFHFYDWIPMVIRLQSVKDDDWQITRKSMLKTTLEFKYKTLEKWLPKIIILKNLKFRHSIMYRHYAEVA